MKLIKHGHCEDFLSHNEELLLKNESFHNLMLGLAYGIRDKKVDTNEPLFYSITDGQEVIACALRSNKEKPLIITKMPVSGVDLLVQDLTSGGIDLASIVGEEASATYFKDQWSKLKKLNFKINIHLGVYECKKVIFPKEALGELILATEDHRETLRTYIRGFSLDCFPANPDAALDDNVEKLMIRHLQNQSIFLLKAKNDELVTMVANVRSTLNGGTISLVYTPPHLRGKGYASYAVALLSEKVILGGKKFTNLFTDLTNPTSNSIYQKIGFVKIGQNIHYDFINPNELDQ